MNDKTLDQRIIEHGTGMGNGLAKNMPTTDGNDEVKISLQHELDGQGMAV
jgi:hypothetical protein